MGFQDNIPIYVQIATDIKEQIISGKLQDGDKLSSVREYSVIYEVTALTIQRAIQLLEIEGVIQTKKGVGSFVSSGARSVLSDKVIGMQIQEFLSRMRNMGISDNEILTLIQEGLING
jgi:DNA-binding transcriptional regulator YhcF (GntR family)